MADGHRVLGADALMRTTTNPYRSDGSPRVFVDMHRPPEPSAHLIILTSLSPLRADRAFYGREAIRRAWLAGEFDVPLYEDDED